MALKSVITGGKGAGRTGGSASNGLTVLDGKLFMANDFGVLLRKTNNELREKEKEKEQLKRLRDQQLKSARRAALQRQQSGKKRNASVTTKTAKSNRIKTATFTVVQQPQPQPQQQRRPASKRKGSNQTRPASNTRHQQLIINTDINTSNNLLMFYNLSSGVKQDNLKKIIEKLSNRRIAKVRVKDLPSGSSVASVWLTNPSADALEKVRALFDGALVNGRTIQVLIAPDTTNRMMY